MRASLALAGTWEMHSISSFFRPASTYSFTHDGPSSGSPCCAQERARRSLRRRRVPCPVGRVGC
eukprot:701055-Pyramimonas_sp.AAC.1